MSGKRPKILKSKGFPMGKNFRTITTLEKKPQFYGPALGLIEKSFHYSPPNRFSEDFAPLMDPSNHHNSFIVLDENESVLAHVGVCERQITLGNHKIPVAFLGGIAVDEKRRGEGVFQELFIHVLTEKKDDVALFLLWSDQEKLYRKFGFYLCGQQFELSMTEGPREFEKTKFHLLSSEERQQVIELYQKSFASSHLTVTKNWELVAKIVSSDLYLKRNQGKITDYFFMNKGQDLTGIIFEYGSERPLPSLLNEARHYGKIWMGRPWIETEEIHYQFMAAPGDQKLFGEFVSAYSGSKISFKALNNLKQEAYFDFQGELHGLDIEEFLRGLFGPGTFEELEGTSLPLFISGLDSI